MRRWPEQRSTSELVRTCSADRQKRVAVKSGSLVTNNSRSRLHVFATLYRSVDYLSTWIVRHLAKPDDAMPWSRSWYSGEKQCEDKLCCKSAQILFEKTVLGQLVISVAQFMWPSQLSIYYGVGLASNRTLCSDTYHLPRRPVLSSTSSPNCHRVP